MVCFAGHSYKATYANFQTGYRCAECVGCKKLTIDAVRQYIESFGYRLLSTEYLSTKDKLDILCPAGHNYKVIYNSFKTGRRCAECSIHKKHTIETVKQYIESFGYQLLSTTYVDSKKKLDMLCPAGHSYNAAFNSFKTGRRCPECMGIARRRTMPNGEEWEPRSRDSKDDQAWAKAVKKRDCKICQACNIPSKKLCAHHIESYAKNPELQTELSNGVALCEPCHTALHSQYGRMTATRSDLEEFIRFKRS